MSREEKVFALLNRKIEKLERKIKDFRTFTGKYLTMFGDGELAKEADLLLKNDRSTGQAGME